MGEVNYHAEYGVTPLTYAYVTFLSPFLSFSNFSSKNYMKV